MNKIEQNSLIFYGRPDGLGNRYEELVLLSNFAVSNNVFIKYYWNNTGNWKYVCRIKAKNIEIIEVDSVEPWPTKNFESTRYWREYISTRNIYHNKNVKLDFKLPEVEKKYISILTRGSDRVLKRTENIPPGFQSEQDLEKSIQLAKQYLVINEKVLPISIHSEDEKLKNYVSEILTDFEQISLPKFDNLEKAYQDLLGLINSEEIILCSKFSSFALTAAMISNKKVIKFHQYTDPLLQRWKIDYIDFPEYKKEDLIFDLNLPKFSDKEQPIVLGNNFIGSYKIDQNSINKTKLLLSHNKKNYIGFEENFKIYNESTRIKFIQSSIFINVIKEITNILINQRSRKAKIKNIIRESIKTIKIMGFLSFFIKFRESKNHKTNFFLFIGIEDFCKNLENFTKNNFFIGAVVIFKNLEDDYEYISKILKSCNSFSIHCELNKHDFNSEGYLSISII